MKTGLHSITELAAEIERRASNKQDLVVDTKAMSFHVAEKTELVIGHDRGYVFDINHIAHRQIAEHTGIPAKYYDLMLAEKPDLLAANVNTWLHDKSDRRLVRALDGKARAFLSDRYRPLENEDLAEKVLPVIMKMDLDVMSCQITDTRLYLKVVDKKVTRELEAKGGKFGDGRHNIVRCLAPAITISNSEVGMGALSVLGGVYDSFCSNLATFGERSTRKYHVGGKHELVGEEAYALLSDETRRATDEALWMQLRDVVQAAFEKAKFDSLCDKIAETTEQKIEGDPVQVVSFAAKKFGMTEGEKTSVLRHLIEGGDLTRFGLYNAITRTAEDLPDYDRATEFERAGGQIIELPKNQWQVISEANDEKALAKAA